VIASKIGLMLLPPSVPANAGAEPKTRPGDSAFVVKLCFMPCVHNQFSVVMMWSIEKLADRAAWKSSHVAIDSGSLSESESSDSLSCTHNRDPWLGSTPCTCGDVRRRARRHDDFHHSRQPLVVENPVLLDLVWGRLACRCRPRRRTR
jgi:hypothetical protein